MSPAAAPSFDPELAPVLAAAPALIAPVLPADILAMRKGVARLDPSDAVLARGGAIAVEHHTCVSAGVPLETLLLRPTAANGPLPAICFLHGGGMIAGTCRTGLEAVLDWVVELGVCVASVNYRLAPEHPYPVPIEDSLAGLMWVDSARQKLGLDSHPLILVGASAGGGLAAAAAIRLRDNQGPLCDALMLLAPMLDDRAHLPSSTAFDGNVPWDAQSNRTAWAALLGEAAGSAGAAPGVAPAREIQLAGLPPTFLDVGAVETFRDETIDFAGRLAQAGVATELHVWAGAFHGFDVLAPDSTVARAARATRLDFLRRRLRGRASA